MLKKTKDYFIKIVLGQSVVPRGLFELNQYFVMNDPIQFKFIKKNGSITAVSENFRWGSIVTSGKNPEDLDKNIKDAILTSFEIPSSFSKEARIKRVGEKQEEKEYAVA